MKTKLMMLTFVFITMALSFKSFATDCNSICEITDNCQEDCPEFSNGKPNVACIKKCEEANDLCEEKIYWCEYAAIVKSKFESESNIIRNIRP